MSQTKKHKCEEHIMIKCDGLFEWHECSICGKHMGIFEAYSIFGV